VLTAAAIAGAVAVVGTALAVGGEDESTDPDPDPNPGAHPVSSWESTYLQIVAHPDDDLYFLNPGVAHAIAGGSAVTTVVVTAAEGDGINVDTEDPGRAKTPVDVPGYSRSRQNGLRRAYALMATGQRDAGWKSEAVSVAPGFTVQRDTLVALPRVRLYFFNLRKNPENADYTGPTYTLARLFAQESPTQATLRVKDSPVPVDQAITRDQVVEAICGLIRSLRPTVLRTLDPDPEHDGGKREFVVSDHVDHTATARFVLEAVRKPADDRDAPRPVVEHYRGYANRYWPRNLDGDAAAVKARYVETYAGADGAPCPGHDCGDYQLGPDPYRSTHIYSTADRYACAPSWLVRDRDGRLVAVAVLGDTLTWWRQQQPGSDAWTAPATIAGGGITPAVAVCAGLDGRLHVVGLRRTAGPRGEITVDLVHALQPAPGRPFEPWTSLGNPDREAADHRRPRELGTPAAAVDADGRLHVFARNFGQGLSTRAEGFPDWGPWRDLGGEFLQDMPRALTTSAGCVEVYVPNKKTVVRWYQKEPRAPYTRDDTLRTGPVASCGFGVVPSDGDRTALYFRAAESAKVLAYRQAEHRTGWPSRPADLGGHRGTGAPAALWRPGRGADDALLVHRDTRGMLTLSTGATSGTPQWRSIGGPATRTPATATDALGRTVVAVLGTDARLHVIRQTTPDRLSTFTAWQTL
jgi:LmbE family N-acetylglucosaminyl deacetylase